MPNGVSVASITGTGGLVFTEWAGVFLARNSASIRPAAHDDTRPGDARQKMRNPGQVPRAAPTHSRTPVSAACRLDHEYLSLCHYRPDLGHHVDRDQVATGLGAAAGVDRVAL